MPDTRRSLRSRASLTRQRSPSPTVGLAMSRPRRAASGANRSSISVARSSPSPDEAKKSIHLTVKMPSSKLREATGASKRNASVGERERLESSEVVRGPRGSRAKRAVVVESDSDEEEEDEDVGGEEDDGEGDEDEEPDEEEEEEEEDEDEDEEEEVEVEEEEEVEEDPDADAEGDDQDADGDVDMNDAEPQPPPPILKITGPPSKKRTIAVTPAQVGKVKSVEAKEMEEPEDDDEELSDIGSEGEEDAEGDEDDMDQEIEGRSIGEGSRSSTPDLSKMTKRQRSRLDQVMGSDFLQLPMEPQIKKHLTAEEHAMRRSEMARRRKNLSEKRNEEEKLDTINRLLKKQAPKRRGKISAEEIATNAMAPPEPSDVEYEKANPVYIRWVSDRDGSRVGVPSEWLEDGLENTIGRVFTGGGGRRMVEEVG